MTTIAVPPNVRPEIVCPSWCTVSTDQHIADLPNWEGYVIHWSAENHGVAHSELCYPDGTPDETERPLVHVYGCATPELSPDEAEALAQAILAAVKEARA